MARKHMEFVWDMGQGKKINCPIQIDAVLKSGKGFEEGKTINPENKNFLSTVYVDKTTGKTFDHKELTHRRYIDKNKGIDVIYSKEERDTFMDNKVDDIMKVEKEYDLVYLPDVSHLISKTPYEIYSLDESERKGIQNVLFMYQLLRLKHKFLVVQFGYMGEYRAGIIVANSKQLLLFEFADARLLKGINQLGLPVTTDKTLDEILEFIYKTSERNTIDLWRDFLDAKVKGKEIKVEQKPEAKVVSESFDWQQEMLKNLQGNDNSKAKATPKATKKTTKKKAN